MDLIDKYLTEGNEKFIDEIGSFWVVLKPSNLSLLQDIFFKSNINDIVLQFKGGLSKEDVQGYYKSEGKAKKQAEAMLMLRDKLQIYWSSNLKKYVTIPKK